MKINLTIKYINTPNFNKLEYIDTPKFSKLAVDVFNAKLTQANLITKTKLILSCQVLTEKLLKIKLNLN